MSRGCGARAAAPLARVGVLTVALAGTALLAVLLVLVLIGGGGDGGAHTRMPRPRPSAVTPASAISNPTTEILPASAAGPAGSQRTPGAPTKEVGRKFTADGGFRRFPGNTFIFPLPAASPLRAPLLALHAALGDAAAADGGEGGLGQAITLLPPSSWHMTLFQGVLDQERGQPARASDGGDGGTSSTAVGDGVLWPSDVAFDAPLADVTALFARKMAGFDMNTTMPVRMAVAGRKKDGITLRLVPVADAASVADWSGDTGLRHLRDQLAELFAIRAPQHDAYEFHLSLAYVVRHLSAEQRRLVASTIDGYISAMPDTFELGPPEFCEFDDMSEFRPLCCLYKP
ncbi:hypothetical protein HK405_008625 [Cladochytrium tenue]|nr:hypothetical protein HK405_008625 [Cladochytrium tenue]